MGNRSLNRVSKGGITGWVRGEVWNGLPSHFFEDPFASIQEMEGKVLKESKWRWAARVMDESRWRGLVYVSLRGVVTETMG